MIKNSLLFCALLASCLACTNNKREENTDTTNQKRTITVKKTAGEEIFDGNCSACHSKGKDVVVGPSLVGVTKRRTKEWIIKFVKNSQAMIFAGDKEAKALFEKYNKAVMTSFNFSEKESNELYQYLESLK